MNVGLPGTGLGGLFYFFSVILMLLIEIYLTIRGRSNKKRWKTVLEQVVLVIIMLIVLYLTVWSIKEVFFTPNLITPNRSVFTNATYVTVGVLFIMIILINLLGLSLKYLFKTNSKI